MTMELSAPPSSSSSSSSSSMCVKCPACSYIGSSPNLCLAHFRLAHQGQKNPFICLKCDFTTLTSGLLAVHMRKHIEQPEDSQIAPILSSSSSSSSDSSDGEDEKAGGEKPKNEEEHLPRSIDNDNDREANKVILSPIIVRAHQCSLCPFSTDDPKVFVSHRTYGHAQYLCCTYCNYYTTKKDNLKRHQVLHQSTAGRAEWKLPGEWTCREPDCSFHTVDNKVVAIHLSYLHQFPRVQITRIQPPPDKPVDPLPVNNNNSCNNL